MCVVDNAGSSDICLIWNAHFLPALAGSVEDFCCAAAAAAAAEDDVGEAADPPPAAVKTRSVTWPPPTEEDTGKLTFEY